MQQIKKGWVRLKIEFSGYRELSRMRWLDRLMNKPWIQGLARSKNLGKISTATKSLLKT
jgi:hypothetical protein